MNLDDVLLIPRVVSHIASRETIDTSVTIGNVKLKMPIIASPMRDVCDGAFGQKLVRNGCYGILHRFSSIEEQHNDYCRFHEMAAAIGVNGDFVERFEVLYNAGCRIFCIDTANGANILVKKCIDRLLGIHADVKFIVGNVASAETFVWCAQLDNVIGVRCGIAGGCFAAGTKVVTKKGKKNIEKIKIGDEVLTHKGRLKKVTGTATRIENKRIFDINGIKCTGNHLFYVLEKKNAQLANEDNIHDLARWVSAEELSDEYVLVKIQE